MRSSAERRAPSAEVFSSMYSLPKNVYRERIDFSKIKTTIPIPNLIEIQKKSYERFLQMNRLPSEREDAGLQSVFKSVFPISDFRENSSLEFIEYSIGNWECKCGRLAGLHHLRKPCVNCGHTKCCARAAASPTRPAATSATSAAIRSA
jgi:DNA-directed RNA polymerase beta subunit